MRAPWACLGGLVVFAWLAGCNRDESKQPPADAGAAAADGGIRDGGDGTLEDAQIERDSGGALVPCGDVTATGRCASKTRVERCAVPTGGQGRPRLEAYDCEIGQSCDDRGGIARCIMDAMCVGTDTRCKDARTLQSCVDGAWIDSSCPTNCVDAALGAMCAPELATKRVNGSVQYEWRGANTELTDWTQTPVSLPAKRFNILSVRGDRLIDSTLTDGSGSFSVLAAESPGPDDKLVVLCAGEDSAGRLAFAVGDPGYPTSSVAREPFDRPPRPRLWSFSLALGDLVAGQPINIPESAGSGAARIFEILDGIFNDVQKHFAPSTTQSVIVWMSPGTAWNCGACMASVQTELAGQVFLHQVWLDGSADDQGYWSDPVSAHELGHYVMAGFGYPPAEGGAHYTGYPTNPGQAWSEGWATFFSTLHRNTGLYYDKQGSTFFWFDLDARTYSLDDLPWQRPVSSMGLDQLIDENEVAAMLRKTSLTIGGGPMLDALSAPRMRAPPFERGYRLRVWSDPDHPEDFEPTTQSIPHLPDFFDALRCDAAISAAATDLVTEPAKHYPYPSASPLCR